MNNCLIVHKGAVSVKEYISMVNMAHTVTLGQLIGKYDQISVKYR